ncbi:hypothetical protein O3G_MSEX003538 [Manduca sexta]|nr:hypothetical protein O3G_MSEX003538 [Manduca sexta]KAG6444763.1 hypothetical protein O3G_MSEX003538 [Manduca sexta]KAG6444764.1 hypothetical protein O3G_MSEX003538 [Manduca sexta]KAG6444765.1 hypothetical protein O3G_MSEX003538 [Manduca sexta]
MSGVLFIVLVPRKEYEVILNKNINKSTTIFENDKRKTGKKTHLPISKCMSTHCLETNKIPPLYKTRSENVINVSDMRKNTTKTYLKASWEEMKQMMALKKNKLKISRSVRGVDILGAFHWKTPLEIILLEILERLKIHNATWTSTKDNTSYQVTFTLESGNLCEELLQVLRTFGIGSRHKSSVSVVPCTLCYKSNNHTRPTAEQDNFIYGNVSNSAWSRFSSSVRARTNLAQVVQEVKTDATLTFDWLSLLTVAAFVAAIGLVENSTVVIVASMLISPLMTPITAATLGTAVRDRSLQRMGAMHEMMGLFFSLVIGFIFGLVICAIDEKYDVVGEWPTHEMITRCELRALWIGILVAIPSGAAVALAVLGEYTGSLVGVAISASLLPPAVNAGLMWAMALVRLIFPMEASRWVVTQPVELAMLGTTSLCLTLLNIMCIFLAGVAVYKIKEVCPLDKKDIPWWRKNSSYMRGAQAGDDVNENSFTWDSFKKIASDPLKNINEDTKTSEELLEANTVAYRRRLKNQYCYHKKP